MSFASAGVTGHVRAELHVFMPALPPVPPPPADAASRVRALDAAWRDAPAAEVLRHAVREAFPGRIAMLSSFGAEAAVALHLLSEAAPQTPVLFLDTGMHFGQTAAHRDALAARLGLVDVRVIAPAGAAAADPRGDLWRTDPDACCDLRKVRPLAAALPGFDCLIGGRKRFHGEGRARLPLYDLVDGQVRLNLLADWDAARLEAHRRAHDLPQHPLVAQGFRSIGCWPCSRPGEAGDAGVRDGRWAGREKTECGIHLPRRAA